MASSYTKWVGSSEGMYTRIKPHDWQLKQNAAQLIPVVIYEKINFYLYVYIHTCVWLS